MPEPPKSVNGRAKPQNGGNVGFEAELFLAADKLRKNLEPSDYKHVVSASRTTGSGGLGISPASARDD